MRNGAVAWSVALGSVLVFDAWLIEHGDPSLSQHARRHPCITAGAMGYLALHFFGDRRLERFDPLAAASRHLQNRHATVRL